MSTDDRPRDSWGLPDADHADLRDLMERHAAHMPDVMRAVMADGIVPMPDDPGFIGWIGREFPPSHIRTRVFPAGGLWWSLLIHLRALDADELLAGRETLN